MAIRGISMAEREPVILKADPGHPDNVKAEIERRTAEVTKGKKPKQEDIDRITAEVENDPDFKPTVFYIGNLTSADRVYLGDLTVSPTMRDGGITMTQRRTERAVETVRRGLVGWENFNDADGKPIPFTRGTTATNGQFTATVSDDSMAYLSLDVIHELAAAILDKNGMTSELEKNFEGASLQATGLPSLTGGAPIVPTSSEKNADA